MRATLLALLAVLAACPDDPPDDDFTPEAVAGVDDHDLKLVLQEQWEIDAAWEVGWDPEAPAPDAAALDARQVANLEAARAIDATALSAADQLTLAIYLERYGNYVATIPCDRAAGIAVAPRGALLDAPLAARARSRPLASDDDVPATTLACYRAYIRYHTTIDLTPEAIHQIGLDELAVVEAEIRALGERLYGTTDLAALRASLDADPAQRFASPEEIMTAARVVVDDATAASAAVFARFPAAPLRLVASPGGSAAYAGPWKDRDYGEYYVPIEPVEAQRRYQLPSVAIHEGTPGHHLERARAFEQRNLPWLRRGGTDTIYVEGWGFYTEYLAEELGLYRDDHARLGALSNRALRAARLVVDTGLHGMGWSRGQAKEFLTAHTLEPAEYVAIQANRYFAWPGQALAYMLGAREILRLREAARAALGDRFSLRDFHEQLLAPGSLPLGQLTAHMERWIEDEAARP
jgi:uncharacterized protein (DUF885 family)